MRIKVIVSFGLASGLAVLSTAAYSSSADLIRTDDVDGHKRISETSFIMKEPIEATAPAEQVSDGKEENIYPSEDDYLLAKIAMAEAEGEDTEGKALVIRVVLNRVHGDGFPDTIKEVIYQPRQFTPISDGRFDRVEPDADCWQALSMIDLDDWDESMGATYFESENKSTWHEENLDFLFQHGSHYFYMDKEEKHE